MDDVGEYFATKKALIAAFLDEFESENTDDFAKVNSLGADALGRLVGFSKKGKMLRGGLSSLAYELFHDEADRDLIACGASLELLQSGLLIHDDIMDSDPVRRGAPAVHAQYVDLAREWKLHRPEHSGEALGICAGDIAFFVAFELIGTTSLPPETKVQLINLCARELSYVGIAQMIDVRWGGGSKAPAPDEVLHLYIYKTGRYTFSLPLLMGGTAAGQSPEILDGLDKIGTALGTVFQLKDDELGLFGDEAKLGKPVGSDVKEGKKTLFYLYLMESEDAAARKKLDAIFGNADASLSDVEFIRDRMEHFGVRKKVAEVAGSFTDTAWKHVKALNGCKRETKDILEGLIEYSTSRKM